MKVPARRDEGLQDYATDRQWEILEAYWEHGTYKAAGKSLGIDKSRVGAVCQTVAKKAAAAGYAPGYDLTEAVPDGYRLRGASTLYKVGEDGNRAPVLQWVKSQVDPDRQREILYEEARALVETLPRLEPVDPPEHTCYDKLLAAYPIADAHLGMYAWAQETGDQDHDLGLAEQLLHRAMDYLVRSTPAAGTAIVPNLGDFFHYDGIEPITPRGKNLLDSDGRYAKMVRTGLRVYRRAIDLALTRHQRVHVVPGDGNHDPSSAIVMAEALATIYEDEPRVTVDNSPNPYRYYEFGSNLVGMYHGHRGSLDKLPLVMARDRPEAWGRTRHRVWWTGHTHKDRLLDVEGVRVESFRTLTPPDAFASGEGYRPGREMVAMVIHDEYGEVARHRVNPGMLS